LIPSTAALTIIVLPVWAVGFVGSMFDQELLLGQRLYALYCAVFGVWLIWLLRRLYVFFPMDAGVKRKCSRTLMGVRCIAVAVCFTNLYSQEVRVASGGMNKVLLQIAVFTMLVIGVRQASRHWDAAGEVSLPRGIFLGGFVVIASCGLSFYKFTPFKSSGQGWASHNKNSECKFLGTFDFHDCWHVLSAIALALWTILLLDFRISTWRRHTDSRAGLHSEVSANIVQVQMADKTVCAEKRDSVNSIRAA